jgi:very-short-patch-repair endonuclease
VGGGAGLRWTGPCRAEPQVWIGAHEVDFFWPDLNLIVETDGRATHLTPQAFEDDRHRDAELAMLGYRVLRFTRRQVVYEPRFMAAALARAIAG